MGNVMNHCDVVEVLPESLKRFAYTSAPRINYSDGSSSIGSYGYGYKDEEKRKGRGKDIDSERETFIYYYGPQDASGAGSTILGSSMFVPSKGPQPASGMDRKDAGRGGAKGTQQGIREDYDDEDDECSDSLGEEDDEEVVNAATALRANDRANGKNRNSRNKSKNKNKNKIKHANGKHFPTVKTGPSRIPASSASSSSTTYTSAANAASHSTSSREQKVLSDLVDLCADGLEGSSLSQSHRHNRYGAGHHHPDWNRSGATSKSPYSLQESQQVQVQAHGQGQLYPYNEHNTWLYDFDGSQDQDQDQNQKHPWSTSASSIGYDTVQTAQNTSTTSAASPGGSTYVPPTRAARTRTRNGSRSSSSKSTPYYSGGSSMEGSGSNSQLVNDSDMESALSHSTSGEPWEEAETLAEAYGHVRYASDGVRREHQVQQQQQQQQQKQQRKSLSASQSPSRRHRLDYLNPDGTVRRQAPTSAGPRSNRSAHTTPEKPSRDEFQDLVSVTSARGLSRNLFESGSSTTTATTPATPAPPATTTTTTTSSRSPEKQSFVEEARPTGYHSGYTHTNGQGTVNGSTNTRNTKESQEGGERIGDNGISSEPKRKDVESRIAQMLSEYPQSLRNLVKGVTTSSTTSSHSGDRDQDRDGDGDRASRNSLDSGARTKHHSSNLDNANGGIPEFSSFWGSGDGYYSKLFSFGAGSSSSSASSSESKSTRLQLGHADLRNDPEALELCRSEEAELLDVFVIAVHPAEADVLEAESETVREKGWFLLDANWFRSWTAFVKGGKPPSSITNRNLLDGSNAGKPLRGLEAGNHYVAVDSRAWGFLKDVYGADVAIHRRVFDIYDYS